MAHTPAFGLAVIAPLMLAGAVAGSPAPSTPRPPVRATGVKQLAAVASTPNGTGSWHDAAGAAVITVSRPPTSFHIAAAAVSAPPPPAVVVHLPGTLGIPKMALAAYRNAERIMAATDPGCGVSWNLLAGIGRIESMHANGGATDARGTAVRPIYGPLLDGSLPGNEIIVQSVGPGGRVQYARAIGPMQFLPGTWARYASDGKGDGTADPQNVFDASLAAARYLCSGGLNLRDQSQVMLAILRYNNSMPYALNVLGWAAAYATGVVPVDLPPLTGPIPPIGDAHLEATPEGLGPGLPANVMGLSPTDPLARLPLVSLGPLHPLGPLPGPLPFADPAATSPQAPPCPFLFCPGYAGPPAPWAPAPWAPPPGPPNWAPPGAPPGPAPEVAPPSEGTPPAVSPDMPVPPGPPPGPPPA